MMAQLSGIELNVNSMLSTRKDKNSEIGKEVHSTRKPPPEKTTTNTARKDKKENSSDYSNKKSELQSINAVHQKRNSMSNISSTNLFKQDNNRKKYLFPLSH